MLDIIRNKINIKIIVLMVAALTAVAFLSTTWIAVSEVNIIIENKSITEPIKIVHISDLHDDTHFINGNILTDRIHEEKPNAILISGDMINGSTGDGEAVYKWIESLEGKYPIYYSLGNHELYAKVIRSSFYEDYMKEIKTLGVTILDDDTIQISGNNIKLVGLSHIPYRLKKVNGSLKAKTYNSADIVKAIGEADDININIMLAHDPTYFEQYKEWGADVVLSGHIHGGAIRMPLLGGLISPNEKLLPKYDAGLYKEDNKYLYVSRGIGTSAERIRIFSRPELVIINIE